MDEDTIGRRIRRIRRAQDLSQSELAERAGTTTNTISRIEKGYTLSPHADLLGRLARGLGVPTGELFPQGDLALPKVDAPEDAAAGHPTVAVAGPTDEAEDVPRPIYIRHNVLTPEAIERARRGELSPETLKALADAEIRYALADPVPVRLPEREG